MDRGQGTGDRGQGKIISLSDGALTMRLLILLHIKRHDIYIYIYLLPFY